MRSRAATYGLLLVVVATVYGRSVDDPFHFDDLHSVVDNPNLRSLNHVPRYFVDPGAFSVDSTLTMYRPLLLTSFALNHAISKDQAWSYHVTNIVVHGAVVLAIFELLLLLLGQHPSAVLGSLLFAVHPALSESVYYVSSRSESLAALMVLLALIAHLAAWRPARAPVASVPLLALVAGLLSKSTAIVFLPLVLLVDVLLVVDWRQRWRQHAAYWSVGIAYMVCTHDLIARATLVTPVRSYAEQFWSQVKGVVFYVQLLATPRGLSVDHQFQLSSDADLYAGGAALFVISLLGVAFAWRGKRSVALLLCLWFLVALAPASIVPLNVIVNEHRIYLSGVAMAAGGACLSVSATRRRVPRVGLWLLVPVLALLSILRGEAWNSEEALWLDARTKGPQMARPQFVLGEQWLRDGRLATAAKAFEAGLRRDPGFGHGYRQLVQAYVQLGEFAAATEVAERAVGRLPAEADMWALMAEANRTRALSLDGSSNEAVNWWKLSAHAYDEALQLAPATWSYHDNLGNTLQTLNRPDDALPHHLRAVELAPDSPESRLNLGNALRMLGRLAESEAAFMAATDLRSTYVAAWLSLASLYEGAGALEQAEAARRRAQEAASGAGQ